MVFPTLINEFNFPSSRWWQLLSTVSTKLITCNRSSIPISTSVGQFSRHILYLHLPIPLSRLWAVAPTWTAGRWWWCTSWTCCPSCWTPPPATPGWTGSRMCSPRWTRWTRPGWTCRSSRAARAQRTAAPSAVRSPAGRRGIRRRYRCSADPSGAHLAPHTPTDSQLTAARDFSHSNHPDIISCNKEQLFQKCYKIKVYITLIYNFRSLSTTSLFTFDQVITRSRITYNNWLETTQTLCLKIRCSVTNKKHYTCRPGPSWIYTPRVTASSPAAPRTWRSEAPRTRCTPACPPPSRSTPRYTRYGCSS